MTRERAAVRAARGGGPVLLATAALLLLAAAAAWFLRREEAGDGSRAKAAETPPQWVEASDLRSGEPEAVRAAIDAGVQEARTELDGQPNEVEPPLPLSPSPVDSIVWGYVLGSDQAPIAGGAYVVLTDALGERRSAQAAADGSYSIPGLEPGRWFASASGQGCVPSETVLELGPDHARVQLDFALQERPSLLVRALTPDGRPFREADERHAGDTRWPRLIPIATFQRPTATFMRVDWNERFEAGRLRHRPDGGSAGGHGAIAELELFASLPLFVSLLFSEEVIATQEVPAGASEVVFELDPLELDGHLADLLLSVVDGEDGGPIQAASVFVVHSRGTMPLGLDSEGRIILRRRPPGRYEVRIGAEGFANANLWLDLAPGEVLERTIRLERGVVVSGRAIDEQGHPIRCEFELSPLPPPNGLPEHMEESSRHFFGTQSDGTFELRMGAGRWLLQPQEWLELEDRSSVPRLGTNVIFDTLSGPVDDLLVRLAPPGTAVVSWSGPDRELVKLRFVDTSGHVRVATRFWGAAPQRCELPPGLWQARVTDSAGAVLEERAFTLGVDPVVLELGLRR